MDKRIIEGIEACRPGSEDLRSPDLADVARQIAQDPEARAYYERVQAWDARIAAAIHEVSVPAGLSERILDRLRQETVRDAGDSGTGEIVPAVVGSLEDDAQVTRDNTSRWSRRQWLAGFATMAATLLAVAFLSSFFPSRVHEPLEEIAEGWFQQLTPNWQDAAHLPTDFAVPAAVVGSPTGWQWIASRAGGGGVAYRLQNARGATAMLYVVQMSRSELPTNPPAQPQSTTQGKAVGYWQSGARVYVLVVTGDERSYRTFVASSPVPLA